MKGYVDFRAILVPGSLALSGMQFFLWTTRGQRLLALEPWISNWPGSRLQLLAELDTMFIYLILSFKIEYMTMQV